MIRYYINPNIKKGTIHKDIYGHFAEHLGHCVYGGLFVGKDSPIPNTNGMRNDVVEALKEIRIPVLRWPGGCFADEYHWKDGIGPLEARKKMINTNWGGLVEDNSFGTHEFMELCRQLGCDAYVNGNLGSGSVQEMSEWMEYMTFDGASPMSELRRQNGAAEPWKVAYFAVGNENWGGGGNMTADYYADLYRRYATFLKHFPNGKHPEWDKTFKIACGPNADDYSWMETVLKKSGAYIDGISLHYYTVPFDWNIHGSATDFDEETWYRTLKNTLVMESLLTNHIAIMDAYDREHRIKLIVDEWGTWYDTEPGRNPGFLYQQNTMRDAMVAGINLNLFNKHCGRIRMTNIAQIANVLQSMVLTEDEKMVLTPSYYVFKMYREHQNAELVDSYLESPETGMGGYKVPQVLESCSMKDDVLNITLNNLSLKEEAILDVFTPVYEDTAEYMAQDSVIRGEILTGAMNMHNTFENQNQISSEEFTRYKTTATGIQITLPPCSIVSIWINLKNKNEGKTKK